MSQEIFDLVATETVPQKLSPKQWEKLQANLNAPNARTRSAASRLLTEISSGTPFQTQQRAKAACCLILYTIAGLTLEQIGLAFGHDFGHIPRLVKTAADLYRDKITARDDLESDQAPTVDQLSLRRKLHHRDRDRLTRKARRFAAAILREPETERDFFLATLQHLLTTNSASAAIRRPPPPSAAGR